MNVESYLKRINYEGSLNPSHETLTALQKAHLLNVPFENLDIALGRPIVLNDEALFNKIVERRRGGFCYELNGLFAWLLRELGFDVVKLSAGVFSDNGGFGPYFDHMALLVQLERPWLVDVGFGDSFRRPIPLDEASDHREKFGVYRLDRTKDKFVLMQLTEADMWKAQYRFTLQPYEYPDYEEMCLFHQTSPDSPFTKGRVCTLATRDGRVTLRNERLITTVGNRKEERPLRDEERGTLLREMFGVDLAVND